MPAFRPPINTLAVLTAALWTAGCISGATPQTRFFVLTPLAADSRLAEPPPGDRPLTVEVTALRIPQYLERPQIVTRTSGNGLVLAEYDQWGGNLRKNMTRVLAANLSHLLGTPDIAISPHRPPYPPDYRVEVEVLQFERATDTTVRLTAQWRLSAGRQPRPLATRLSELASPPVPTGEMEPTVAAMSGLLGDLSRMIGQTILAHVHGGA